MTILFTDSFSHYASGDILKKWSATSGGPTINATAGRRGNGAMLYGTGNVWARKSVGANKTALMAGAAFKFSTMPTNFISADFMNFRDSGANAYQVVLRINPAGKLEVTRGSNGPILGTGTTVLTTGVWYYIEWKVTFHGSAGTVKVVLNGTSTEINLTSQNTAPSGNAYADTLSVGESGNSTPQTTMCDLYLADTAGSAPQNDLMGDVRVDCYFPNSDGATLNFTPNSGTTHYNRVNESTPDGDTTYNQDATANDVDLYGYQSMTHTPVTIFGTALNLIAEKDDAGVRSINFATRSGGTTYTGFSTSIALSASSYLCYQEVRQLDPATSAAWTKTGVNAAQFGPQAI